MNERRGLQRESKRREVHFDNLPFGTVPSLSRTGISTETPAFVMVKSSAHMISFTSIVSAAVGGFVSKGTVGGTKGLIGEGVGDLDVGDLEVVGVETHTSTSKEVSQLQE